MNAPAKRKWIQTIHIAKTRTGIEDDAYRALLSGCAGVQSAKEIETWEQYNSVMAAFKAFGFIPAKKPDVEPQKNRHPDWITEKQEKYIRGLWKVASKQKDEQSLRAFVRRITGTEDVTWLRKKDASKVILALRKLAEDAGVNPDYKD